MGAPLVVSSLVEWSWIASNHQLIVSEAGQQVELASIAVGIGVVISVPLAFLAWYSNAARSLILGIAGLIYTIPSIALFVLVQPLTGYFSIETAESALVGYTLLILIRNLLTGLDGVDPDVREAAEAMGYTPLRAALFVYLPLALPSLFAGLRVATVTVVGLVTITAFIEWGGLGQMVISGLEQSFYTPIVVGLVLSTVIAAVGDALIVGLERATVRWTRRSA
jgi:osmoprotectant transport system permease protein